MDTSVQRLVYVLWRIYLDDGFRKIAASIGVSLWSIQQLCIILVRQGYLETKNTDDNSRRQVTQKGKKLLDDAGLLRRPGN